MDATGGTIVLPALPRRSAPRSWGASRAVTALMLREMVTTYGRSPGGYVWAVHEPLAAITLLSFAFSLAFRAPSLGVSFPMFYATGFLPFIMFLDAANKVATSIRFSRPLLNFAALTWIDILAARFLLNFFTQAFTACLVLGGLLLFLETRTIPAPNHIAAAVLSLAILCAGVGVLNTYLFLAYPAWERVWQVMTRPLFIISGVFFLFEDLPHEVRDFLWFNPLIHVVGELRRGFYPTYPGSYVSLEYVLGIGLATGLLGLLLLQRTADGLIHK